MQQQIIDFINKLQIFLPMLREHITIINAIILVFIIWALKYQILRQNRRFLQQLKQEWQNLQPPTHIAEPALPQHLNAYLLEQKILVYQTLINLKSEYDAEQNNVAEIPFTPKRYYHYFKELRDIVIHNRFYLSQETEYLFSQLMQDGATQLLQLKQIENQLAELPNPAHTEQNFTQLIEQENEILETFYQYSRAQMGAFLDKVVEDALKLRTELGA